MRPVPRWPSAAILPAERQAEARVVPYKSKAEERAASSMTWRELLDHVKAAETCDETEARRQIGNAIADRALLVRWEDQRKVPIGSSPLQAPIDEPPRDAAYWQECKTDPDDPNRVQAPDGKFRQPLFDRGCVSKIWTMTTQTPPTQSENILPFPRASGGGELGGRPTEREQMRDVLQKMLDDGYEFAKRPPQKTLAEAVAKRSGKKLGDAGWSERTIIEHVSEWLHERDFI
jgi:hypothetical protein